MIGRALAATISGWFVFILYLRICNSRRTDHKAVAAAIIFATGFGAFIDPFVEPWIEAWGEMQP